MARRSSGRRGRGRGFGGISLELVGKETLDVELEGLTPEWQKLLVQGALQDAAALIRARIQAAAPSGATGRLRQSIRSSFSKKYPWSYTGLKKIPGEGKSLNYYATLIQGRKPHRRLGRPRRGSPQMSGRFDFFGAGRAAGREVIGIIREGSLKALSEAVAKTSMIEGK